MNKTKILKIAEKITGAKLKPWNTRFYFNYGFNKAIWIDFDMKLAGANRPGATDELVEVLEKAGIERERSGKPNTVMLLINSFDES